MVNLSKGNKINLTKEDLKVEKVSNNLVIGLGWKEVDKLKTSQDVDCDASAILVLEDNKVYQKECLVYYGHKEVSSYCVHHCGDNLVGGVTIGKDSEQILVYLDLIPESVKSIDFIVNIYECNRRSQDFGMIEDAYIRVFDQVTGTELIHYNLSDNYKGYTGIKVARLIRMNNTWGFEAIGKPGKQTSISEFLSDYKHIDEQEVPADLFKAIGPKPKLSVQRNPKSIAKTVFKFVLEVLEEMLD